MTNTTANIDIIRTKLHRPPVTRDLVPRMQLLERLEYHRQRPLTLISAQAGYGKSTLASHWLDASACPGAWVSLDEDENDLGLFLTYVVAAIHTLFPDALRHTQALLHMSELPSGEVIARILLNELALIEDPFMLVLDDYHRIRAQAIHDVLDEVLRHPPSSLHLVLITRRDPQFSLPMLRARGQVTEIRLQDLRFSTEETTLFLQQALDMSIDDRTAEILHTKTEGWVTGLRLAALSLFHHKHDRDSLLSELPEDNHYVTEYFVSEVLSQQPAAIQHYLFATAMLNRFCARLCEAMCRSNEQEAGEMSGQEFLAWLEQTNLFVIALDSQQQWFRYHHMFQTLLQDRVHKLFSPDDIRELHSRASTWFDEHGLIEEALHHAVAIDDFAAAGRLIGRHRQQVAAQEQWFRINRWLALLPAHVVEGDPELLLLKAWSCQTAGHLTEMADMLDRFELILTGAQIDERERERLSGESSLLRSFQHYHAGSGQLALTYAEQAVNRLPAECVGERAYAILMLAVSSQMTGELARAYDVLHNAMKQGGDKAVYQCRLLRALGFMQWIAADLMGLSQTSATMIRIGTDQEQPDTAACGSYFQGIVYYHRNRLAAAQESLTTVVSAPSRASAIILLRSTLALSLVHQAQGQPEQAWELVSSLIRQLLETGNTGSLALVQAFQAELALRQNRLAEAVNWTETCKTGPPSAGYSVFAPELTIAKVLLSQGTQTALQQADAHLAGLHEFFASTHNRRFLMEVLLLQTLLQDAQDDEQAALSTLADALALAEPGGIIRPFVDVGPHMASLVQQLMHHHTAISYSGKILAAFRDEELRTGPHASQHPIDPSSSLSSRPLIEDLTHRELEILQLLAQRFSNQEIGEKLFIATMTVKKHTARIYVKLNVHNRREAVAKARVLGILSHEESP